MRCAAIHVYDGVDMGFFFWEVGASGFGAEMLAFLGFSSRLIHKLSSRRAFYEKPCKQI